MKTKLFFTILISSITGLTFAQVGQNQVIKKKSIDQNAEFKHVSPDGLIRCGTNEFHLRKQKAGKVASDEQFEQWLAPKIEEIKAKRTARLLPSVIRIPVVVHIISNGDAVGTAENIAEAQVLSQITVLNQDFRKIAGTPGDGAGVDTTIEFCMATIDPNGNATNGINRITLTPPNVTTPTVIDDWETQDDIETAKANTIWDPTKYLNMWTFKFGGKDSANGGMSDLLGYAQFPSGSGLLGMPTQDCIAGEASTDGLTMRHTCFGSRTIFPGGVYSGTTYDKGRTATHEIGHAFGLRHIWGDATCGDDYCADTPTAHDANYTCTTVLNCDGTGNEMVENYMDYTNDECMSIFTQNQKDRMLAVLQNSPRRDDLLVSPVCNATPQSSIQFKRIDCSTRLMNAKVNEGNSNTCNGYTEYTVPVSIGKAPTQNAIVTFSIDASSVANAADVTIQTPTVTFPKGATADKNFVFRVLNDAIIEPNENLVFLFTVNANGGDAFAHSEGNKLNLTILNNDIASSPTIDSTLLDEDFEDPAGWTLLDGDADGVNWGLTDADGIGTAPNILTGTSAYSQRVDNKINNYLISPEITIPTGANSIDLSYIIGGFGGSTAGNYTVYFATNVSSATNINAGTMLQSASTVTGATNGATILKNHSLLGLAGQTGHIVFRHSNSNTATAPYLLLDNVKIAVNANTVIQTAVNTATHFNSNVSINGSFVARDASSQNLMADINNTTNFDYGCTTVAVSRDQATAGAPAVNYGPNTANNLKVMAKTFTITPTNNSTNGNATLKFYFTEAEIAAWESATGNSRTALRVIKQGDVSALSTTAGTFGTNTTLSANVANGIGGVYYFGIQNTLDTSDFEFDNFSLYPNPNKGNFTVKFDPETNDKINIDVYDLRGRQIFERSYVNNGTFNQEVNLNNISSGVYLITISNGQKKTTKRIVIE